MSTVIRVAGPAPYDVVVGHDLAHHLPALLGPGVQRVGLVFALPALAERVRGALGAFSVTDLPVVDGEAAKTVATAEACWDRLGAAGFTRSDALVCVGGGAVTDLGGFVAAAWLRGIRVVHVPTTVLGMVDAAVGGKTGVNTAAGKNLVGAFHEPAGVLCDLGYLETLPRAELVAGLGEVVKCGFIADPEILRLVETTPPAALRFDSPVLRELVERAIRVKATVVAADLREAGGADGHPGREALNYGHTLAHAIERSTGYAVRHGEAVAIGSVYVAELARLAGLVPPSVVARHRSVLSRVGLPTTYDATPFDELLAAMAVDKKSRGSQLRFVVLSALGQPVILAGPPEADLRAAYAALAPGSPS